VKASDSSWYDAVNWNFEARFPTRCKRFHTLMLYTARSLQQASSKLHATMLFSVSYHAHCEVYKMITRD